MAELSKAQKDDLLLLEKTCSENESYRTQVDGKYKEWLEIFLGNQWKSGEGEAPKPMANYTFSTIRSSVSLLTDNEPQISCKATDSDDLPKAEIVKKGLWALWEHQEGNDLLETVLYDSHIYGQGVIKDRWNKDAIGIAGDKGEIETAIIRPQDFYPSPAATHDIRVIPNCHQAAYLTLGELAMMFGKDAVKDLKPDGIIIRRANPITGVYESEIVFKDTDNKVSTPLVTDYAGWRDMGKGVVVKELWIWNVDLDDYQVIIGVPSQNKLFTKENVKNPLENKTVPYSIIYNYKLNGMFNGISEVQLLLPQQREININKAMVSDHLRLMGKMPWITDYTSDVDVQNLPNSEGTILFKNQGTELRKDQPPPLPNDIFKFLADNKFELDTISGIHDVTQGRRPVGINAGVAIAELQEAGQIPIRAKARRVQTALKRRGKIQMQLMQKYYKIERLKKIASGISQEYFKSDKDYKIDEIKGEYDISFDLISGLAKTQSSRFNEMLQLATVGLVDRRAALEYANVPNREDIIKRMGLADIINKAMASGMLNQLGTTDMSQLQAMMANMQGKKGGATESVV